MCSKCRMGNIITKRDHVSITKVKYEEFKKLKEENLELKEKLDEASILLKIVYRNHNYDPNKIYKYNE